NNEGLLAPIDLIETKCSELMTMKFDLVVNLSHTTFSSICAGLVKAKKTLGAYIDEEKLNFSSKLFEEFNLKRDLDRQHYLDWFRKGLELDEHNADWSFGTDVLFSEPLNEGR